MMELIAQNMAPIIFTSLVIFLLLGYPVAFSLAATGLFFGGAGIGIVAAGLAVAPLLALRVPRWRWRLRTVHHS